MTRYVTPEASNSSRPHYVPRDHPVDGTPNSTSYECLEDSRSAARLRAEEVARGRFWIDNIVPVRFISPVRVRLGQVRSGWPHRPTALTACAEFPSYVSLIHRFSLSVTGTISTSSICDGGIYVDGRDRGIQKPFRVNSSVNRFASA